MTAYPLNLLPQWRNVGLGLSWYLNIFTDFLDVDEYLNIFTDFLDVDEYLYRQAIDADRWHHWAQVSEVLDSAEGL